MSNTGKKPSLLLASSRILDNLSDPIFLIDDKMIIKEVNKAFLKEFGLSRQEALGASCHAVIFNRNDPCETQFCPLAGHIPEENSDLRKEYLFLRKGRKVYYDASYSLIRDEKTGHDNWLIVLREITKRKELELSLEKSKRKYKELFDNAREGLALFNIKGRILECNFSLAALLGYSKRQLEEMTVADLAADFSKKILIQHLADLKILGFVSVEMDFLKKNGELFPVEANISWIDEEDLFRIMVRDISLEKKIDEARQEYSELMEREIQDRTRMLKEKEEEASTQKKTAEGIIYGTPIPMFVLDERHRITFWNKACEKLTGLSSRELIGTDRHWEPFYPHKRPLLADLIIDNDLEGIEELYRDMKLGKSPLVEGGYEAEHFFPYLGSEGTHLYMNASAIKDSSGRVKGAIVTYQDFSERYRILQALKSREAFVQNLVQSSIDGIIATAKDGKIAVFNRGAMEILGFEPEAVTGQMGYSDLFSKTQEETIRRALMGKNYGPEGKIIHMETTLRSRANNSIPVRISGTLLMEDDEEVGTVLFLQDLSEVHRLQKEKEQSEKMAAIGRTVSGLAHYIKNILTGIKGGAYVINSAMSSKDLALARKGWAMVERSLEQIGGIVTDMLIYSKERKPDYKMESVDPNDLVLEVEELIADRARLSGVKLRTDLSEGLQPVNMDRMAIHRCLLNLISNAVDACTLEGIMNDRGKVMVKTDSPHGWAVRFRIEDNGTGMDEKTQKRLFSDFYTTKGYKGTGLGLPVTNKIVLEHGGKLEYESQLGKGTTFSMFLP